MSDLADEYRLEYFEDNDFVRRQCPECGDHFWTRGDREICGEPPCEDYGFIGDPGFEEDYSLGEMREAFLSFFEAHDHGRVEPSPVEASRWRDDVLLTQASIYDFQHHVTSGRSPPPANPLAVSQPCIRMNDIDNVGKTGRHTMAFEMMGHHAFNADEGTDYAYEGEVYWKDETVRYCVEFFAEFGVPPEDIVFIEDPWVGGGNAGPALEVIYEGLELATLVFMKFVQDPEGEYELKDGNSYREMDRRIVDTGYGLERWTWMSQGTPTVYEAVYPEMIDFLTDNAGIDHTDEEADLVHRAATLAGHMDIDEAEDMETARATIADELDVATDRLESLMEPVETVYAIADHSRTLAYMFGDGIVPSNAGAGYLARMVLRRTKRLCDRVGVDAPLDELVDMQADRLGYENRDVIREMVRVEVEKYAETLERGNRRVRQIASEFADRGEPIPAARLVELYDSHGVHPDIVEELAAAEGADVERPDDFFAMVAARHGDDDGMDGATGDADERLADLPETERLYYEGQERTDFEAVVLDVFDREDGYDVVLDQTLFYPEGGGQPADTGTLSTDDGTVRVSDVQEDDGVIRHRTDEPLGKGEFVKGSIDADRRRQLMRNHTATHVVGYAARQVLGEHVRQAGARKGLEASRLDVRHFDRISREEVTEIERVANEVVRDNVTVTQEWPDRHEAEAEYGWDLYQGGLPTGEQIRIITVGEDVQACGGTHVSRTGDVGAIKVRSTEPIQDGVERITFAAGDAAIRATQETEDALYAAADVLDVEPEAVPETAERFFEEWKERGKRVESLKEELAALRAGEGGREVDVDGTTAVIQRLEGDSDELRATANAIVEDGKIAVLGSGSDGARFVVAVPEESAIDAGGVVGELAEMVGGGGGGPPDFAEGGGPEGDRLEEALEAAPEVLQGLRNA